MKGKEEKNRKGKPKDYLVDKYDRKRVDDRKMPGCPNLGASRCQNLL